MRKTVLLLMAGSLALSAFDGASAYKKCAMCHGKKGEKVALKTSPVLNTLSEDQLTTSVKAIIDGSSRVSKKYLGMHQKKLKGVGIDDAQKLADHIVKLK
ncbi:MAG: c-type cytochrome [Campylobacterota bacterium]